MVWYDLPQSVLQGHMHAHRYVPPFSVYFTQVMAGSSLTDAHAENNLLLGQES